MRIDFKNLWPYLACIIIMYLLTLVYFSPELLEGQTLQQGDVQQFKGMSARSVQYYKETGEMALWNDAMFAGIPDYLIATGVEYGAATRFIWRLTQGFLPHEGPASLFFVTQLCGWLMLLCFGLNPWLALLGGIAYGFNSYNFLNIEAGHVTKTWALAYAALVLGGLRLLFSKNYLLGAGVLALGLLLQLRPPHFQITFYLMFVCIIFSIGFAIQFYKEHGLAGLWPRAAVGLLAVALAGATAAGKIAISQEFSPYSIRGEAELASGREAKQQGDSGLSKEYAFSWSQGIGETLTLLIPGYYGGSSGERLGEDSEFFAALSRMAGPQQARQIIKQPVAPTYRGDQPFTGGPLYAGAIVCFLFVLSMFLLPNYWRYTLLAALLFTFLIAWGRNAAWFNYFLFDYVPGFNKFRTPSMALGLSMLLLALGAATGVARLPKFTFEQLKKPLFISLVLTAGLCLFFVLFAGSLGLNRPEDAAFFTRVFGIQDAQQLRPLTDAIAADRASMIRADALRSLLFTLSAAALIYLYLNQKLKAVPAIAILLLLVTIDLWAVDKRYLNNEDYSKRRLEQNFAKTAADEAILRDPDPHYRVLNLNPNFAQEARTSYHHKSLGGYFAAKLRRYQDLVDRQLDNDRVSIIQALQKGEENPFANAPAVNMLNTKYIIFGDDANAQLQNPNNLGDAWLVKRLVPVASPDEEIEKLASLNPAVEAVADTTRFDFGSTTYSASGEIELTAYEPREINYRYNTNGPALAVLSEVYYPKGWRATLADGTELPIKQVNYLLRAVELPAGEGELKLRFDPQSFIVGETVTRVSSWLVCLLFLAAVVYTVKRDKAAV